MNAFFANGREAGIQLGERLRTLELWPNPLVLGLLRGGIPIGFELSLALHASLDILIVRKLGIPGHEELAMGAVASGGIRVVNTEVVDLLRIPPEVIDAVGDREEAELQRREMSYRANRPAPDVNGRFVILCDDGIATGSTMMAAIQAMRKAGAARVLVAAPVAAKVTVEKLSKEADDVVVLWTAEPFSKRVDWAAVALTIETTCRN